MAEMRSGARGRRGVAAGLLVGALVGGIAPAGGVVAAGDKVTVTWFVGLGAPAEGAKARRKAFNGVVKAFNRSNPGIRLVVDIEPGDVHDALAARIADGRVPDVMGPMTLRELSFADAFADLAPLASAAGFDTGAFDAGLLTAYQHDGSLVGLPFGAYPSVTYFNGGLFDQAGLSYPPATVGDAYVMPDGTEVPWDFDTVRELAKRLTLDANGNDATSPAFDPASTVQFGFHDQFGDLRRTLTLLGGADPLVTVDEAGSATLTIPPTWLEAMDWYYDAIWTDRFMPTTSQIDGSILGGNAFGSGHVGMAVAPLWYTCCVVDAAGTRLGDWDIGVVPVGLGGVTTSPLHADVVSIAGASAHPAEAFAVLQYLLTDPRAGELWQVAPAATAKRADWYAGVGSRYPDVTRWAAGDVMLGYPDVPSHVADLPHAFELQARMVAFRELLLSDGGGAIDLDEELDRLQADLQAIADG